MAKRKHKVSFSGGKDSSAMLLRMIELGMPIDEVLFCDTGKEFPQLYAYVKRMQLYVESLGIKFTTIQPKNNKTWDEGFFGRLSRGKLEGKVRGWPLMIFHCWWSRDAKFVPLNKVCEGHERYIGFAADETKRLRQSREKDGYNFPLADWGWTESDALDYLKSVGWAEEFHLDFNRTGCFLCPKQGGASLETLCRKYPEQWAELLYYAKASHEGGDDWASNEFKPGVGYPELLDLERQVKENPDTPIHKNAVCGGCAFAA